MGRASGVSFIDRSEHTMYFSPEYKAAVRGVCFVLYWGVHVAKRLIRRVLRLRVGTTEAGQLAKS